MPEYCITRKEIWLTYLYLEADNEDNAIQMADDGEGNVEESEYLEHIANTSIRNTETNGITNLEAPPVDPSNPNSIFHKSKKQEEVDSVIQILANKNLSFGGVTKALKILRNIKNI